MSVVSAKVNHKGVRYPGVRESPFYLLVRVSRHSLHHNHTSLLIDTAWLSTALTYTVNLRHKPIHFFIQCSFQRHVMLKVGVVLRNCLVHFTLHDLCWGGEEGNEMNPVMSTQFWQWYFCLTIVLALGNGPTLMPQSSILRELWHVRGAAHVVHAT